VVTMSPARELIERIRQRPLVVAGTAVVLVALIAALVAFANRDTSPASTSTATAPNGACVLRLHGKGGAGGTTVTAGDITTVRPTGNAEGWGGRQWLYFPATKYAAARQVVADAIVSAQCTRVVLHGFSNGAAFAASLYCQGETFDGRLVGVVVDDPVTDHAVEGCAPAPGVPAVLYWTGALEGQAVAGWDCAAADWTCEGGSTIGIASYAAALATTPVASPHTDHQEYTDAPEPARWLAL
jgi:hypothetical protein